MYNLIFFTNILRILDERGMTRLALSEKSGISISFLSDLTNGKANPSLKVMETIANTLDVPLSLLLDSTDMAREDLQSLSAKQTWLPPGYVRINVILTEFQAFTVSKLDQKNREVLWETYRYGAEREKALKF